MRKSFIIFIISFLCLTGKAQDLIVTSEGDSINCKITKTKGDMVYFTFKHVDEYRSTLLPLSKIQDQKYAYYQESEVPANEIVGRKVIKPWRVAFNLGYGHNIAKVSDNVPDGLEDYVKGLKSGFQFGGDVTYYFSDAIGVGGKYLMFKSSNEMNNIVVTDDFGKQKYGDISDEVKVTFIGPTFSTRYLNAAKTNAFITGISLGYMGYRDDKVFIDKYKLTGSTLGLAFDLGYDFSLSEKVSLGFQASYIAGNLSRYEVSNGSTTETVDLEKDEYESLHRLDFSIGIRFY
ncbi:hypothetical protein DMA11_23060 [Marinilabiliaceae bacterium JC017]|nr:hypothetical protein DMA11_23060 [Marinilabiliaceae bacterium JC017]